MNSTFQIFVRLRSTLAHAGFEAAGTVIPFRREPVVQRNSQGDVILDDYAIQSSDPEHLEFLRDYALRLMRIVWQSKSDGQWRYSQLQDRIATASMMTNNLGDMVNRVLAKMGATTLELYNDDAEFYDQIMSAIDNVLVLNLLRQPGERLLLTARMQMASQARYENRELQKDAGGEVSLFDMKGEVAQSFKSKRAPYIPHIPVYSGNAFRNGLVRRNGAGYIMDKLQGYPSVASFRNLMSGGSLQKSKQKGIDIDARRQMVSLMPLYGLLGGSFNTNNMIEGSGKPLKLWPIVQEAKPVLHPSIWEQAERLSMSDIMSIEANAAREDALLLAARHIGKKPDDLRDPAYEKNTQNLKNVSMPFEREVMIAGTELFSEWSFFHSTPLQVGAFVSSFVYWAKWSVLGGVSSHGHGASDIRIVSPDGSPFLSVKSKVVDMSEEASEYLALYDQHIKENTQELKDFLEISDIPPAGLIDVSKLQDDMEAEEKD